MVVSPSGLQVCMMVCTWPPLTPVCNLGHSDLAHFCRTWRVYGTGVQALSSGPKKQTSCSGATLPSQASQGAASLVRADIWRGQRCAHLACTGLQLIMSFASYCIVVLPGLDDLSQRVQELLEMSVMVAPPVRLELTAAVNRTVQVITFLPPSPPVRWNQQSHMPSQH